MTIAISLRARRRTPIGAIVLMAALGLAATASAAPTLTFKITALPIPGFPGTGDILGAGAVIEGEGKISGTEYGGFPPPVVGFRFYAPVGAKLHPQGFVTCPPNTIEQDGAGQCPKQSVAGPKGTASGVVSFGTERVHETASVQPFFAPGGALEFFADGKTPVLIEVLGMGHIVSSAPPFGPEFLGEIPPIETVPGALDASEEEGTIGIGAAYRRGGKTISYITLPKKCPRSGFPVKLEVSFLGGAVAATSYNLPCPRRSIRHDYRPPRDRLPPGRHLPCFCSS
jgi:hypothetical protein